MYFHYIIFTSKVKSEVSQKYIYLRYICPWQSNIFFLRRHFFNTRSAASRRMKTRGIMRNYETVGVWWHVARTTAKEFVYANNVSFYADAIDAMNRTISRTCKWEPVSSRSTRNTFDKFVFAVPCPLRKIPLSSWKRAHRSLFVSGTLSAIFYAILYLSQIYFFTL